MGRVATRSRVRRVAGQMTTRRRQLLPLVVDDGCCIGCGACSVVSDGALTMQVTDDGLYEPRFAGSGAALSSDPDALDPALDAVCPFGSGADEDELSAEQFGAGPRHPAIGRHERIWAGSVADEGFRLAGTSGGMTTWIVAEALRTGAVDAVVHVRSHRDDDAGIFSRYAISTTVEELHGGRGSRYHVQTLEDVMAEVRRRPGRYAVVGVPCFIKAIRLLARADATIADRIGLTVSLVCGHLKSAQFSTYLAWSVGIEPGELDDIDYRAKVPGRPANRYAISATPQSGAEVTKGVEHIPMSDWGIGLFKPSACDYCDDVVGETADVSCGDAWLPPLMSDWKGANVVVARSELVVSLIEAGIERGDLDLEPWTADQVAASQESGLRHRREGLSVRLANREKEGRYTPAKRVAPAPEKLDEPIGKRMLLREQISQLSHVAFREALEARDLSVFHDRMRPLVSRYQGSRSSTLARRAGSWVLYRTPAPVERLIRRATRGRRFT